MNELIDTAVAAAIAAGEAILEIYEKDFEVETKSDNSPLTAADKASHAIIVEALEKTPFPVLSEESAEVAYEDRSGWTTYWLVDPLDGTKEFIKKNGEFTVNIALIRDGEPIMGVVYAPVLDTLYCGVADVDSGISAWKTAGCSGKDCAAIRQAAEPISISRFPHLADPRPLRVVASRSHCNDETLKFITDLESRHGQADRVSSGSSLKLCMVAEGSADIYPRIAPTMEWDTAAAHAVVAGAGGAVFEFDEKMAVPSYSVGQSNTDESPGKVRYNKENLLNPYFIVSGLSK